MPWNDPPEFTGLELFTSSKVQWFHAESGHLVDNVTYAPQTPVDVTLDPAVTVPFAPTPSLTFSSGDMPVAPWINPPTGSAFGSPTPDDLDPHPDYFAIYFSAGLHINAAWLAGEDEIREDASISFTPSSGSYTSDTSVTPPYVHTVTFEGWVQTYEDGGWLIPPTHDLDASVPYVSGAEGTDILWPWTGSYPTIFVDYAGRGSDVDWISQVVFTPYWLVERPGSSGLSLGSVGRGVRLVGGTLD